MNFNDLWNSNKQFIIASATIFITHYNDFNIIMHVSSTNINS